MTRSAGARPMSVHMLGTLWLSLTAYGVRACKGEEETRLVADRKTRAAERTTRVSILIARLWKKLLE